jgi:ubiquinone/menaquinone biosynthesis C-methylase UbiE
MDHRQSHHGAKQPHIFSHTRADVLDDPEREAWLPTPLLVEMFALGDGERALDFGAGGGRYSIAFARAYPRAEIIAYDVQPEFVAMIDRRAREASLGNLSASERIDGRFDRVFAANVMHEIGDADLVLMRDALNERGHALIIDWDAEIDRPTGPPAQHAHSRAEALDRLHRAGFTKIEVIEESRLPYHFVLSARS